MLNQSLKSTQTRIKILQKGMEFSSTHGLSSITIGKIAKASDMSRTGVISHFSNKEDMQLAILKYTEEIFIKNVLKKSYSEDPLKNLLNLKSVWLNWISELHIETKASCPFIKAAVEYKDQNDSLIRTFMKDQQTRLLKYLSKIVDRCKFEKIFINSVDSNQFAYEFYNIYLGHSIQKNLLESATADNFFFESIDNLIKRYKAT